MENKLKHLEMIQGIINRLAQSSFLLKGWSVVLISALFALAAGGTQQLFIYLAYFPAIAFWVLDAYFLWQERLYRALYDRVRKLEESQIDFAMSTKVVQDQVSPWADVVTSKTLLIFHGTLLIAIIIVMLIAIIST